MSNTIIVTGNLSRSPELRFSTQGTAIASFGVADNRSWKQGDEWKEEVTFWNVVAFKELAENACASLSKGSRVVIEGRVTINKWTDRDGNERQTPEIVANEIGAALRYATATIEKTERTSPGNSGGGGGNGGADPVYGDEEPFVRPSDIQDL
jgi:single-strand DNA-binding protein